MLAKQCALMHVFLIIGACALIRTNTVSYSKKLWTRLFTKKRKQQNDMLNVSISHRLAHDMKSGEIPSRNSIIQDQELI